jgi:hypothetical protein
MAWCPIETDHYSLLFENSVVRKPNTAFFLGIRKKEVINLKLGNHKLKYNKYPKILGLILDEQTSLEPYRKQVKSAPNQIGPKSNWPQVKIIEELKLSSKYSCVLYQ